MNGEMNGGHRASEDVLEGIKALGSQLRELAISFEAFRASTMSRGEIEAADAKRVAIDVFEERMRAFDTRMARAEALSMRVMTFLALALGPIFALVVWIATNIHHS